MIAVGQGRYEKSVEDGAFHYWFNILSILINFLVLLFSKITTNSVEHCKVRGTFKKKKGIT
jgi:hypothetical protein